MLARLKFRYTTDPSPTKKLQRALKMPKRNADTYDSDSGFIEDAPSKSKKSKSNTSSTKPYSAAPAIKPSSKSLATSKTPSIDENGDKFWPINVPGTRRVTINQFKGKWMVNIREYYDANGEMKPAKKVCYSIWKSARGRE